jgi:hypothetical protein
MNEFIKILTEQIRATVLKEEEELRQMGEGIYFMPELALSYLVGKNTALALKQKPEFDSVVWQREVSVDGNGPSDLVFTRAGDPFCIVEFKMVNTDDAYRSDIEKLASLQNIPVRLFCALVDAFTTKGINDERIIRLEAWAKTAGIDLTRIGDWRVFETIQHWYTRPVSCVTAMWVLQAPAVATPEHLRAAKA